MQLAHIYTNVLASTVMQIIIIIIMKHVLGNKTLSKYIIKTEMMLQN